eukprot:Phypoly_transcript_18681.p1 GENE.Phypoly_transcript_18681~~Phypoly_transcript_18681.p1  ORF type:complete len:156 (+),score=28.67 Phypoly_transcript_18681:53-520(+)
MGDRIAAIRKKFEHNGRTIYEWDQTLEEVNIYIKPPEGVTAKMISCEITPQKLTIGLKGNPPFINEDFYAVIKKKESFWTVEDGEIHITLQKMLKGDTWLSALKGHQQLDPFAESEIKKNMMLERFQAENPGFDFSGAEFSGQAPDPRTFMGGVS